MTVKSEAALYFDLPSVPLEAEVQEWWSLYEMKLLPSSPWPDTTWSSLLHLPRPNVSLAALVAYLTTCHNVGGDMLEMVMLSQMWARINMSK